MNKKNILLENYERIFKQKLIKEAKELTPEDFYDNDGWNVDAFKEIGLMDWLDDVAKLQYEIKMARRGSYGIDGKTFEDLTYHLENLKSDLKDLLEDMDYVIENSERSPDPEEGDI